IRLANRPPGTQYEFEARQIIDAGFLELVRYGVRCADDPLIVDSLKVVDAVLKCELPQGSAWLRYNFDGYGQRPDGTPFKHWGQGRCWPLLTGERAHYELAAGRDIAPLIRTYEAFATSGQMLPEQVWDDGDIPEKELWKGKPAGSAVPLVWAHAEYLKLLRSVLDGKVFDRIDAVYERYCGAEGRKRSRRGIEVYCPQRPIQSMERGRMLRIMDERRFEVVWTADNWQTTHTAIGRSFGSAGFSADLEPPPGSSVVEWTLHWVDPDGNGPDTWLGYNVKVEIEAGEARSE
ncbi:MAG: glycoside hydrolase family 15 protein, partial [Acidobacteriota bacterium]